MIHFNFNNLLDDLIIPIGVVFGYDKNRWLILGLCKVTSRPSDTHFILESYGISKEMSTAIKENAQEYRLWKNSNPEKYKSFIRKIIHSDIDAVISKADYLICLWDENVIQGGGTHAEVTFAYWYHKPVFLVNQLKKVVLSSWIEACSTSVFDDFESLRIYLLNLYKSKKG